MTTAPVRFRSVALALLLCRLSPPGAALPSHRPVPYVSYRPRENRAFRRQRNCASKSRTSRHATPLAFFDPTAVASVFGTFAERSPYAAAFATCATNGFAADWVAQRSEQHRYRREIATEIASSADGAAAVALPPRGGLLPKHDMKRSLAFILYGGFYQGMALEYIYNDLFTRIFGANQALLKMAVSQFVMAPLLTLPVAYVFKGLVFGKTLSDALDDYWVGLSQKGLLLSFWKLWIPIQFLVFAVIPVHFRIPFSSCFSFLWTVILSRIATSERTPKMEREA